MSKSWGDKNRKVSLELGTKALGLLSVGITFFTLPALAQIVPDATLGAEGSQVTPNVNVRGQLGDRIDGGAVRGSSLFHSFSEFNVNEGQRVYFSNPAGIADIFSRVTGANISNILGTLGVDGAANLFLLNPNGILFGTNALVDIQGSFVATTGDRFIFPNGAEFGASNPQAPPLLTMSVPVGVQYGAQLGTITNTGNLTVGQDLTLAGGNLNLQGQLRAGRDVTLQAQDTLIVRDIDTSRSNGGNGGNITLSAATGNITVTGNLNSSSSSSSGNSGNGGAIALTAGGDITTNNLDSFSSSSLSASSFSDSLSSNSTSGNGGVITLSAGGNISTSNLNSSSSSSSFSSSSSSSFSGSLSSNSTSGNGGAITLSAGGNISTGNFSSSSSSSSSSVSASNSDSLTGSLSSNSTAGNGGAITLFAGSGNLSTGNFNSSSSSSSSSFFTGSFSPDSLTGSLSSSFTSGNGGAIALTAQNNIQTGSLNASTDSGSGGDISITSLNGEINTNNQVSTATNLVNAYDGGNITFQAKGNITINAVTRSNGGDKGESGAINIISETGNVTVNNRINSTNVGENGSDINITALAGSLFLTNQAQLETSNRSSSVTSTGGDININTGSLYVTDSQINTNTSGPGDAGNVTINARNSVALSGGGQLLTETSGTGRAGNVSITAADQVALIGGEISTNIQAGANVPSGQPSNITIKTGNLSVTEGGKIAASVHAADPTKNLPAGQGDAGNINVDVTGATLLSGTDSRIENVIEAGARGQGGTTTLNTGSLTVDNDAAISASTNGTGNAGQINVRAANDISLQQGGRISSAVRAGAVGNGGRINLESTSLTLSDRGQIESLSEQGSGTAGDVNITASTVTLNQDAKITTRTDAGGSTNSADITLQGVNTLQLSNNSEISASTANGRGGNVSVMAPGGTVALTGNSRLKAEATQGGQAGNVQITANQVTLREGSSATVSSPQGQAGNLSITANTLLLDRGQITAETGKRSDRGGGNINLQLTDSLRLRNQSLIFANATGDANGGNITITTRFVTAEPSENSDIIANAFTADGGQIDIVANGIFGLQQQNGQSFDALRGNRTNDISGRSQFSILGNINIESLTNEPSQGLVELPIDVVDPSSLIARGCGPIDRKTANRQSQFVVTGRGGRPPGPNDLQTPETTSPDWVTRDLGNANRADDIPDEPLATASTDTLVEARGMVKTANGELLLTAESATAIPHQSGLSTQFCSPVSDRR